jgi:hypothetical protein
LFLERQCRCALRTDRTPTNLLELTGPFGRDEIRKKSTLLNNGSAQYPTLSLVAERTYCNTYAYTSLMLTISKLVHLQDQRRDRYGPANDATASRYAATALLLARIIVQDGGCNLNGA